MLTRKTAPIFLSLFAVAASSLGPRVEAGDLVRLAVARFDPLRDGEPDLAGRAPAGPPLRETVDRYRLVQLDSAVTPAAQRAFVADGFEIAGYLPEHTLILRLPSAVKAAEAALDSRHGVRWVGRFRPGYKLGASLASGERSAVRAYLFRGEDPAALAAALGGVFDDVRVVYTGGGIRPYIDLEPSEVRRTEVIGALARDPAVQYLAAKPGLRPLNDQAVWIGQSYDRANGPLEAGAPDPKPYTQSAPLWNRGLTGTGQIVAVADAGLEQGMCPFDDPAVPLVQQSVAPPGDLALQPQHRKVVALNAPLAGSYATDDSFRHGTHVAGSVAGDDSAHLTSVLAAGHDHGDGVAPGAKLVFEDVSGAVGGDCFTSIVVPSLQDLLEQEYRAGARISTNSWGTAGGDQSLAVAADAGGSEHEDLLVLFSAGNDGANGMNAFAACKNCLAVGASENFDANFVDAFGGLDPENMTAFSSQGPTADGRIKPDVVAPGFFVNSARLPVVYVADANDPACDPGAPGVCRPSFGGCYVTDLNGNCHVDRLLGTSMATPIAAGLAALVRQYFVAGFHPSGTPTAADSREPTSALVKAMLINGARSMSGRIYERRGSPVDLGPLGDAPDFVQGWGRVQLDDALYFAGDSRRTLALDIRNASGLATGETVATQLLVSSPAEPLAATLVWTDVPSQPVAAGALVNDLDLELTAPDGRIYRGNQWAADAPNVPGDRESLADAPGRDVVNNVEGIRIAHPLPGLYTARIVGREVPGDGGQFTQGAALVATGAVGECTGAAPPAHPRITDFDAGTVTLAWDPVPGALGYTVSRNASGCRRPLPADHVVALPAGAATFVDTAVQAGTAYHYTVRARLSAEGCETADSDCVSALAIDAPVPPPVPDGTAGAPLVVAKGPTPIRLALKWDVQSCPAEGYHLLYGPLGGVGGYELTNAACTLGVSGSFSWFGVPPGDLWFVVVSSSAGSIEGSWGARSDGSPRGDGAASALCGTSVRSESIVCGGFP